MPAPEPTPEKFWGQLKTAACGFLVGLIVGGKFSAAPEGPKAAQQTPVLITINHPATVPAPDAAPSPHFVPQPIDKPVKHRGVFYLTFVEPIEATPESAAIRTAAGRTDWKALKCHWWAKSQGSFIVDDGGQKPVGVQDPELIVQESPEHVSYDDKNPPPAPIISRTRPRTIEDVMATIQKLRGE